MTSDEPLATATVDGPRPRATGGVLAYCAACERYSAVIDVRVDDVVGEGPAHVCGDCRTDESDAQRTAAEGTAADGTSGERRTGVERPTPIVPHTGQSTDVIAAGPER